jgi:hypothetical protein
MNKGGKIGGVTQNAHLSSLLRMDLPLRHLDHPAETLHNRVEGTNFFSEWFMDDCSREKSLSEWKGLSVLSGHGRRGGQAGAA